MPVSNQDLISVIIPIGWLGAVVDVVHITVFTFSNTNDLHAHCVERKKRKKKKRKVNTKLTQKTEASRQTKKSSPPMAATP